MIEELTTHGKIKFLNTKKSAPVFPKSFYANYNASLSKTVKANVEIKPILSLKK